MARAIQFSVVVARRGPVGLWRDHGGLAGSRRRLKDARVGVKRFVGDQRIGLDRGQWVVGPDQVVCLAAGVAQRVDQGVDLGAQSAARTPNRLAASA